MEISGRTKFYTAVNAGIGILSLYKTPLKFGWLTAFAAGILLGAASGAFFINKITDALDNVDWRNPNTHIDNAYRIISHQTLLIPGSITAAIHSFALATIYEIFYPAVMKTKIPYFSALTLGFSLGNLFCLELLERRSEDVLGIQLFIDI